MSRSAVKSALAITAVGLIVLSCFIAEPEAKGVGLTAQNGEEVGYFKDSYALVIGVSKYTAGGIPSLPGVATDIREVSSALKGQGFQVVEVMYPDRDGLEKAFNDFINRFGLDAQHRLLIYFAELQRRRRAVVYFSTNRQ